MRRRILWAVLVLTVLGGGAQVASGLRSADPTVPTEHLAYAPPLHLAPGSCDGMIPLC